MKRQGNCDKEDLWLLPGPLEEEPDDLLPGPRAEPPDTAVIADWAKAESVHAARLARVAGRLGALDDRLLRGPEGWRHRLALIEAADLSWFAGDRVSSDRNTRRRRREGGGRDTSNSSNYYKQSM